MKDYWLSDTTYEGMQTIRSWRCIFAFIRLWFLFLVIKSPVVARDNRWMILSRTVGMKTKLDCGLLNFDVGSNTNPADFVARVRYVSITFFFMRVADYHTPPVVMRELMTDLLGSEML